MGATPSLRTLRALREIDSPPAGVGVRRSGDSEAEDVTFVEYRQGAGVYPHVLVEVSHVGAEFVRKLYLVEEVCDLVHHTHLESNNAFPTENEISLPQTAVRS